MYIDFTISSRDNNLKELKLLFPSSNLLLEGTVLKSGKKIPYNEFSLIYEKNEIFYIDDLLLSFQSFLGDQIKYLSEYIKSNNLKSSLCIVIKKEDESPAISIANENIIFLCNLNASIDFDYI